MDQPALPLNFYCRSARLCLKKAAFARKARSLSEELQHLRKFESLVLNTIPCHPNYYLNRGETHIAELQISLVDVEKRIRVLESELQASSISPYCKRISKLKPISKKSSSRLTVDQGKNPRKTRKKTTKKRATWEDWATRLHEASYNCKSCGRTSPSLCRRSPPPRTRKSPERTSPSSRSPRKSPCRKIVEAICGSCVGCGRHESEVDGENQFYTSRFRSPDPVERNRLGDLSSKVMASSSRINSRLRDSSGSPISRALAPLEDDFINLQAMVLELKGSFDGFKVRHDEEGRWWRGRTEALEKELQYLRNDTEADLTVIKKNIQGDVKNTLDCLTKDLAAAEDLWAVNEVQKKEKLEHVIDDSSAKMEEFKEKMNFMFVETKAMLMKGVDEKIANSMGGIKASLKNDFEILELGISRDVEELRREMTSRCESFLTEVELASMGGKQRVELLMKEALEKCLPQKLDSLVGKEKTVIEMKEALCLLWKEVESLSKGKREGLKDEDGEVKMDSSLKTGGADSENVRRGLIKQAVERLLPHKLEVLSSSVGRDKSITEVKEELRTLWTEVESIAKGRKEVTREGVAGDDHLDNGQLRKQLQYVRKEAMQARIDAEDVRKDCKVELESVRRCVGDIEFKISHLEAMPQLLDDIEKSKNKIDKALAVIEKEKEGAIKSAADVAVAASKAGKMVDDVVGSVSSEKRNARRKSSEFQESLALEKDMVAESAVAVLSEVRKKSQHLQESLEQDICKVKDAFATEVKRMSMDLNQEKESAVAAASEVRNKTQEFQKSLRDAFAALEKERDAASMAASEVSGLAAKAEGLVAKITKIKEVGAEEERPAAGGEGREKERSESFKDLSSLEAKLKETSAEQMALKDKVSEAARKVRKLETTQTNLVRSVEEVRIGATGLEKSASQLVPKFENAASLLKEVEKRIGMLESFTGSTPLGRKKKRGKSPLRMPQFGRSVDEGVAMPVDAKIVLLESKIDHVASATYTNLRILDTKVENLSAGVQTAMDDTTATDNKCSALGQEVVRVFRMFLSAKDRNQTKAKDTTIDKKLINVPRRPHKFDTSPPSKVQGDGCVCCKGNAWASTAKPNPNCPQHSQQATRNNNNSSSNRGVKRINVRLGHDDSSTDDATQLPQLQCALHSPSKQNMIVAASSKSEFKADMQQDGDGGGGGNEAVGNAARHTNVRLEPGRIHVNVRHH